MMNRISCLFNKQHNVILRFVFTLAGKMFKSVELPFLVQFFHMFYNDKPVDWLLDHLIQTKICNWEKNSVSRYMICIQIGLTKSVSNWS